MKWLRLYSQVRNDPKILLLDPATRWYWVALLTVANEQKVRGMLPERIEEIALELRVSPEEAQALLERLIKAGLIDRMRKRDLRMHNWEERQRRSDEDVSTDRVRRFRERSGGGSSSNGTRPSTNTKRVSKTNATQAKPVGNAVVEVERELEEEQEPPNGGEFAGACEEPISSPQDVPQAESLPPIVNDPAAVERIAERAERLFPLCELGRWVRETSGDYLIGWIDEALTAAHEAGKSDRHYMGGILRRYTRQQGPDRRPVLQMPAYRSRDIPKADEINRLLGITPGGSTHGAG